MKVIDTRAYVSVLREQVEAGEEAVMLIAGNSMSPFLVHGRDYICFCKPVRPLAKGDMVFYQRENGQYVMHRICKAAPEGFYITGDSQMVIEGPVKEDQIFAVVTKVCRKGKWIQKGDFWWDFFEKVWINMIPMRRAVRRIYAGTVGKCR